MEASGIVMCRIRKKKGGLVMKKMLMAAAALTIAVAIAPSFVDQSLAASAKRASKAAAERSPYCDMAKAQRNTPSWNEHYGCLKTPARHASAHPAPTTNGMATAERDSRSTYCGLAKNQRNTPSWNEYYGCLH
jgi:hypothetical protein